MAGFKYPIKIYEFKVRGQELKNQTYGIIAYLRSPIT
jgi:hypothetical protein